MYYLKIQRVKNKPQDLVAKAFDLQALMHAPQPHPKPKAAPRVPPDAAASGVVAANAATNRTCFYKSLMYALSVLRTIIIIMIRLDS